VAIKSEISWKRRDADGNKVEVNARRFGGEWLFSHRPRRHDQWVPLPEPPMEDWMALLDALERRVARRLSTPDEVQRVRQTLRERHPEA